MGDPFNIFGANNPEISIDGLNYQNVFPTHKPPATHKPPPATHKDFKMKFTEFVKRYPNYSRYRFSSDDGGNVVFLFNGQEYNPFDSDGQLIEKYHFPGDKWKPENINDFLYKKADVGFPLYKLNRHAEYKITPWNENPEKIKYVSFDVYITPHEKTHFTFRDIFSDSKTVFKTPQEARRWLDAPNISYWAQALNFAVWCSTGGCGVTRNMINDSQVGSFYKFHVIFTIRRKIYLFLSNI